MRQADTSSEVGQERQVRRRNRAQGRRTLSAMRSQSERQGKKESPDSGIGVELPSKERI
ncbi:MAG: hypothetical protein R8K20_11275 [Gallionellaceae bacterium]